MSETLVSAWVGLMWTAIWQSAVLFALIWLACRFLPQIPAKVRAFLWWLIPVKLLVGVAFLTGIPLRVLPSEQSPFALLSHRLDLLAPEIKAPDRPSDFIQITRGTSSIIPPEPLPPPSPLWPKLIFGLWAAGVVALGGLFIGQWIKARFLWIQSVPIDGEVGGIARQLGVLMGLSRTPQVRVYDGITSPIVVGAFRPGVILPEAGMTHLSPAELEMSLAHELAHIRRADMPLGLLVYLAKTLFFFLPVVWWAARHWETEREAACDALALEVTQSSPSDYGRMLMKIVIEDSRSGHAAALGATATYHSLKERLLRMKVYSPKSSRVRTASILLAATLFTLVLPWQILAQTSGSGNEIRNGGFEDGQSGWTQGSLPPNANVPVTISRDTQTVKTGKASLRFEKSEKRFFPVAMMSQQIPFDGKRQRLKLGLWVKAQSVGKFTLAVIMPDGADGKIEWGAYVGDTTTAMKTTDHDWKYYTSVIAIPSGTRQITLALQMYGPGTVWVDDVSAQYVPDDTPLKKAIQDTSEDPDGDIKDVANEDRKVGGDPRMRYFMIGKGKEPAGGYKLLLVMPGGDGSADFNPFIRRIWKGALPEGYILAQLVAPKWSEDQFSQIVWPTNKQRWASMKFSTEQFLEAVITDVQKSVKVDPRHIYTLSWSSGGPAAYAASMSSRSIKGSFVAMSVYKPEQLPPASAAKGHAYYLLHSPTDFIPIAMPRKAVDELSKAGAKITLDTYEGGHGWHGDVFGTIRRGIEWLEKSSGG
jgi:beta-lactamase regulating signal transducer with metallopeptidase domain/predicted esterase